ncbi:MAG TPA: PEP-CTERM sorting domain-containing protein [Bryobacteraceae bacterium]|nr:PEP-CTERM sorting domain-containing protein [Bryobacteraceae bacterium]
MQKIVIGFAGALIFGVLLGQAAPIVTIPEIVSSCAGLAEGDIDSNFVLIDAPDGVPTGVSPRVVRSTVDGVQPAFPLWPGSWVPNDSESQWLALNDSYSDPGPSGYGPSDPAGWYTYVLVFYLPSWHAAQTASIIGSWSVDNRGELLLNNTIQHTCYAEDNRCFDLMHPFQITSGFQQGVNYLYFRVWNENLDIGNPAGFRFAVTSATYEAPEPSTVALLICGLGGLVLLRRRRAS